MSDLYPNSPSPSEEHENFSGTDEQYFEEQRGFAQEIQLDHTLLKQIERSRLSLSPQEVFHTPSPISKLLNKFKQRQNHVYTCISQREYPLDIKNCGGIVEIPLFNRREIDFKLSKLKPEIKRTISYLNVGCIKIMIKSTFRTGVDAPIKLALLDRRLNNVKDALFGSIQGNLSYGKLIFTCNPRISVSLLDKNINQILCLAHEFTNTDLMNEGYHPYTITYMLGYSLSNSHHSLDFKPNEPIRIDHLFNQVGKISETPFQELTKINGNWTMDLSRKPLLGEKPRLVIKGSNRSESSNRGLARSLSRLHGLPRQDDIHTVSRRIKELSLELE